ncbi:hypothetical protein BC826DRAFT_184263 [Russula brevipes]|nr:hypothetical protein BC826DRAFT_184263 [Russula brevipes]
MDGAGASWNGGPRDRMIFDLSTLIVRLLSPPVWLRRWAEWPEHPRSGWPEPSERGRPSISAFPCGAPGGRTSSRSAVLPRRECATVRKEGERKGCKFSIVCTAASAMPASFQVSSPTKSPSAINDTLPPLWGLSPHFSGSSIP